jgi:hypothetical protein
MQPLDTRQSQTTITQGLWFRAIRFVALCSVFAITIPWYVTIFREPGMEKSDLLIPLYFLPLWGPYFWVFLRLNSTADPLVKKKAVALAVSWGVLGFLLFSAVFLLMASPFGFRSNEWGAEVVFGGLSLLQLSLIAASIKAYLSMKPEPRDGRILLWPLSIAACIVLSFFLAFPFIHLEKPASNEAGAFSSLRNINTAQSVYAKEHPDRGFAASLRDLGPPPGAELIDEVLASGLKNRYIITMLPGPRSDGRIKSYTVIARPQRFGKDETRSFFTDESGTLHATPKTAPPRSRIQSFRLHFVAVSRCEDYSRKSSITTVASPSS